jgi:hypothetical protein
VTNSQADLMRELHDEHAQALWGYCVRLTNGDRPRAQDVVQETLLRAWRNPKILDQTQGSARAWLWGVRHSREIFVHASAVVASPACGALIQRGTRTSSLTRGAADEDVRATAAEG